MRVETELISRSLGNEPGKSGFKAEWKIWKKLFNEKYRDRTMIGVLIMVFQRTVFSPLPSYVLNEFVNLVYRMEWY